MIWTENHYLGYHAITKEALAVDDWYLFALYWDNALITAKL
jgi:hypothetical protein